MADETESRDAEWRERLSPEQYAVTRQGATERAFTGRFLGSPRGRRLHLRVL